MDDSREYNMNHPRRGKAIILNHKTFSTPVLHERTGTDTDRDNLKTTLSDLGFHVEVYEDKTRGEIDTILTGVSKENHQDADCILVVVMTHGDSGELYDKEGEPYYLRQLVDNFRAEKSPSLAGKPKMFIIQACQGRKIDKGFTVRSAGGEDSSSDFSSYTIPNSADFLVACSTFADHLSYRNTKRGSWFIEALCRVLKRDSHNDDLLSMITSASRIVATEMKTEDGAKQIPCVSSLLTKKIYFQRKWPANVE